MKTPLPKLSANSLLTLVALLVVGCLSFVVSRRLSADAAPVQATSATNLLGTVLPPEATVQTPTGQRVNLTTILKGGPGIVYILGRENCLDCSQIPTEMRIMSRKAPHLGQIFIGVGADTAFFNQYTRTERIQDQSYLDPTGAVLKSLGLRHPPAALLVDGSGRVLYVDTRAAGEFSRYGTSRVFGDLARALVPR